jgi:hypothetical protein
VTFAKISSIGAACLGMTALAVARDARAGPSARLVYARSPEASSCPDEAALRSAVAARLGYDPFFAWAKQTVVVQVWRESRKYRARIQLVDPESLAHGMRELASSQPTCADLFDAAALAISIAMASLPEDESPPAPASAPTLEPPAPAPAPPGPTPPAPTPPAPALAAPAPSAPAPGTRFTLGFDALGVVDSEPTPTAAFAVFAGLRLRPASASFELRADAPAAAASAAGAGRVRVWSYQAAFVPCARYRDASLCAVGAFGLLFAESTGVTYPKSDSGSVVTAGVRVGYEWPLSDRFSVRTHLDVAVDLRRARMQVGGADAWTAPLVAASGGAGIAANFE